MAIFIFLIIWGGFGWFLAVFFKSRYDRLYNSLRQTSSARMPDNYFDLSKTKLDEAGNTLLWDTQLEKYVNAGVQERSDCINLCAPIRVAPTQ